MTLATLAAAAGCRRGLPGQFTGVAIEEAQVVGVAAGVARADDTVNVTIVEREASGGLDTFEVRYRQCRLLARRTAPMIATLDPGQSCQSGIAGTAFPLSGRMYLRDEGRILVLDINGAVDALTGANRQRSERDGRLYLSETYRLHFEGRRD